MFSGEEPWANHRSVNTLMDLISLSKDGVPYSKLPNFKISNKIKIVDNSNSTKKFLRKKSN